MNRGMQVSVIVPVYKAAGFVRQAVESALMQPETTEIILVEDGSPDNSWEVCVQLAAEYSRFHLYRHPDGGNHGAGATRNLAIQKSICDYIAFLDADDYFLPGRFSVAKELFEANPDCDGIYEPVALYVENEVGAQRWQAAGFSSTRLQMLSKYVPPEELFATLIKGGCGSFHLDGLVVKRTVFEKTGYLDEDLHLHQDSAFMVKAAAVSRLMPGRLDEPVAMWRVHDRNRFSAPRPKSAIYRMKLKYWYTLWTWSRTHLNQEQKQMLLQAMIDEARYRTRFNRPIPRRFYGIQKRIQLLMLPFEYPIVLKESAFWCAFFPNFRYWLNRSKL